MERGKISGKSILSAAVLVLLALVFLPGVAQAQSGIKVQPETIVLTRDKYPPVKPSQGPVRIYVGEWSLSFNIHNYDVVDDAGEYHQFADDVSVKVFLDGALDGTHKPSFQYTRPGYPWISYDWEGGIIKGGSDKIWGGSLSFSETGSHTILIQVWHGNETSPQDEYSFTVTVLEPEVSSLQASSKTVRALGDNTLKVNFTNGGNENMRQVTLSPSDKVGLNITPEEVELGDVNMGETASAEFTVSAPADVTLGTAQPKFDLSFIDYAGISHTKTVNANVETYRLEPTLSVSAPGTVENGETVEITAHLEGPEGQPISGEPITITVGGENIGTATTGSNGDATVEYTARETGTLSSEASFAGSASYESNTASTTLKVTSPSFPLWLIVLAIIIILSIAGAAAYSIWGKGEIGGGGESERTSERSYG